MERSIFERNKELDNETFRYGSSRTSSIGLSSGNLAIDAQKLRVASYCRVSTEEELQMNSLDNQIVHYTNYIRSNPEWQFAGIFSDLGKSGTTMDSRDGFNKMIRYAMAGKIDMILCKSISRFARNVMDTLQVIRQLKDKNIYVLFEKEELNTRDMQSEFIITMLSAVAQEESRSISENVNWSISKRFERGEAKFSRLLGYKRVKGKPWVIDQREAAIVQEAFQECLNGKTPTEIAKNFIRKGYVKANGREDWTNIAIKGLLTNEKYVGDALCQKTFTENHMSHKIVPNEGQKAQYLIQNNHEEIIDRESFDKVQKMLIPKKKSVKRGTVNRYDLTSRIICGECGGNFHRFKVREKVTWRCSNHVKSARFCKTLGSEEEIILKALKQAFVKKYEINRKQPERRQIIKLIKILQNTDVLIDGEQNRLRLELEKALFAESMAVLDNIDETEFVNMRIAVENSIAKSQPWWKMVEADDHYRKEALIELTEIKDAAHPINELYKRMENIKFLRAWMTRIEVKSSFIFSITWVNGEETEIEVKGGDF